MPSDSHVSAAIDAKSPLGNFGAFSLLAVACLTIMVGCVIVPGLPTIAVALGVGGAPGWLVTLPSLGVVLFGPVAGRLIDRLGARVALCAGLALYALFGIAAVLLHGPLTVFPDRLLLGGATALVMAGGTTLIADHYDGARRLAMIARQGMAIELGGVIFLSVGGYLTRFGWQAPFALYGVALVFLLMILVGVPATREAVRDDSIEETEPPRTSMTPVLIAALCSMAIFFTAVITLPFSLSAPGAAGLTEAGTGYFLSFISLVAVVFAGIMPKLTRSIGERRTLIGAFLCYGGGHALFALATSLPVFVGGGIALGAGFGLSIPLVNHMTVDRSPPGQRGRNLAYLSMAIFSGQFLASPMQYIPGGRAAIFGAAALLALAAALYGLTARARDEPVTPDRH